jgi:ABC-type uncharacterized transport system permease subunit
MRACHLRDGAAMAEFFVDLEARLARGDVVTEVRNLWSCCAVALGSLCNYFAVFDGCFVVALESLWTRSGSALQSLCNCFAIAL